jgi:ABC-type antimicrobial peptide transport system permease subunit
LATALCGIGIFGITSYGVARRAKEIGVRIALGAPRRSIQWMVMGESARLGAMGSVLGLAAFAVARRFLSPVLFNTSPGDPLSIAAAAAILAAAALLGGYLPARRAARLDPACTLRLD